MSLTRNAQAVWTGGLKDGRGRLTSPSGALKEVAYSFSTRFENVLGTNPEELIAAAHAGCFSMALSGVLGEAGFKPERIETTANLTMEKLDAGWTITKILLDCVGTVPGADAAAFQNAADKAKAGCPVSRVLRADITLQARLA